MISSQPRVPRGQASHAFGNIKANEKDHHPARSGGQFCPPRSQPVSLPLASQGEWWSISGAFLDIYDAVKYMISGNARMDLGSLVRTIAHWLPVGKTVPRIYYPPPPPAAEWPGSVSSGNQTFKLVNKTNWVLCWKQGIQKWWPNFWDSVACLCQKQGNKKWYF